MGEVKALVDADGTPLAARVGAVLAAAGSDPVVVIGGDPAWSDRLGLDQVADRWPGIGPLGGLATAVAWTTERGGAGRRADGTDPEEVDRAAGAGGGAIVVVAACDQPDLHAATIEALVRALAGAPTSVGAAALVTPDGRRHPFPSAWRSQEAGALVELVESGARRADAAFGVTGLVEVSSGLEELADLDTPADVATWRQTRRSRPHHTGGS